MGLCLPGVALVSIGVRMRRRRMKVLKKKQFLKKAVRWMVDHGQQRRELSTLILDFTNREDWWPYGLPLLPVNRRNREEYIKQEWTGDLVRYKRSYYRLAIENVLGLYYAVRLEKVKSKGGEE